MADVHEPEVRSYNMSQIKSKDTKPEMLVRKALHKLGYRYTLHKKSLPGKPDLYFKQYKAAIEINGCFWHGHGCHFYTQPKSNKSYWNKKISRNKERDKENIRKLLSSNIRVLIIWECALKGKTSLNFTELIKVVERWLKSENVYREIKGKN